MECPDLQVSWGFYKSSCEFQHLSCTAEFIKNKSVKFDREERDDVSRGGLPGLAGAPADPPDLRPRGAQGDRRWRRGGGPASHLHPLSGREQYLHWQRQVNIEEKINTIWRLCDDNLVLKVKADSSDLTSASDEKYIKLGWVVVGVEGKHLEQLVSPMELELFTSLSM